MKQSLGYLFGGLALCLIGVVILLARVWMLSSEVQGLNAALQDSLKRVQTELTTAKESTPGLGEFMTTIQLHAGKLWFAAKASNWELAEYELDELRRLWRRRKD